jgi:hypothetical protein
LPAIHSNINARFTLCGNIPRPSRPQAGRFSLEPFFLLQPFKRYIVVIIYILQKSPCIIRLNDPATGMTIRQETATPAILKIGSPLKNQSLHVWIFSHTKHEKA